MTDGSHPLVSVIVPVYRSQPYLREALTSVLALDYSQLEIVIQDDASPDDAFEVIEEIVNSYDGPHDVKIGRNAKNLSMANYNVLMQKASAEYIVVAHDDDIQYPDRIKRIMAAFDKHDVSMVSTNAIRIQANGDVIGPDLENKPDHRINAREFAATGWSDYVHGPALSWHRDVFERFGPIDVQGTARASDWIIPYRASLLKGIHYVNKPTFSRRLHANSRGAIGKNTDDQDIFTVENSSESVTQLVYMLETTDYALDHGIIDAAEHGGLSSSIREGIIRRSVWIAKSRNRLHMRKLRMAWISHSEGAITPHDVPNFGLVDEESSVFAKGAALSSMPKGLANRKKIIKAVNGRPWYMIALKKPLRIRYWWTLRRLQRELKGSDSQQQANDTPR